MQVRRPVLSPPDKIKQKIKKIRNFTISPALVRPCLVAAQELTGGNFTSNKTLSLNVANGILFPEWRPLPASAVLTDVFEDTETRCVLWKI